MKKDKIEIETPEKIIFSYNISSTGTRIASYTIDFVIQIIIIFLLGLMLVSLQLTSFTIPGSGFMQEMSGLVVAFAFLLYFLLQWGYFILFEAITDGQSPGKKLMKIRVIKTNGEPLDLSTIILRNLLRAVDAFPVYYLLGGIVSIFDSKSRRIGDIVSDTVVVSEMTFNLKEPDSFTVFISGNNKKSIGLLHNKLNEKELYILRRFLNEKNQLNQQKQAEIAFMLAEKIKKRLHLQEDIENPVLFIERVYRGHTDENKK